MLIGKPGPAKTGIATATAASVEVRGRDLVGDLMGRLTFTGYFYFLMTGKEPTETQRFFLDLLLVVIAEHGLTPTAIAARMTLAAAPDALQGAVAAGLLGAGTVILGSAELCGKVLVDARARIAVGGKPDAVVAAIAAEIHARGEKMPGFGHPVHKPVDPRAERILALAAEKGVAGEAIALARRFEPVVAKVWGRPLNMNVSMAIAACLIDLDFPASMIKAIPILARTAGLLAHLAEEQTRPIGFIMASAAEDAITYDGGEKIMTAAMFDRDAESRPWADQARIDDPIYRRQLGKLFGSSRFYKAKLAAAGIRAAEDAGGIDAIAALPFTEKDELRATRTPDEPVGTHLIAPLSEVARIFSTSGTTGTPSYVPLTAEDIADWVAVSSRSYSASGVTRGNRLVSTYGAGPFVAGITLDTFNNIGVTHIPVGAASTDRLVAAVQLLKVDTVALTPSYALHTAEWAAARGIDLASSNVQRLLVAGEPGGGEPAMRARLQAAWGADVTEAMGIGDICVSIWGECTERQGMHFSGRGFVHFELIDPESGKPVPLTDGAEGELVYTHLRHRAAPLLRFRSRDHVRIWTSPCACGRTAPRVRCIGRTDDMLIVRGVNVFPTALREIINEFSPLVSGVISVRPAPKGFRQDPPLPVSVELGEDTEGTADLAERIRHRVREALTVTTEIDLVAHGSLPRSSYKSKLVDWSEAAPAKE